jgi:hypothetical protein
MIYTIRYQRDGHMFTMTTRDRAEANILIKYLLDAVGEFSVQVSGGGERKCIV